MEKHVLTCTHWPHERSSARSPLWKIFKQKETSKNAYLVMQDVMRQLFCESVLNECLSFAQKDEAMAILEDLGLKKLWNQHLFSLSGGEKRRLVIANAILSRRPLLFFDEPSSGMDYQNLCRFVALLQRIRTEHTIFLVTHDTELMQAACDYVLDFETYQQDAKMDT